MSVTVSGTSPMRLTEVCVTCGSDAHGGLRFDAERYYYPRWVWTGLLVPIPPVLLLVFCLWGRKRLEISFSVCARCARARRRVNQFAAALWALTAASTLVSVWLDNAWILLSTAGLLAAAVTLSILANAPLRVGRLREGVFTVRGFGRGANALGLPGVRPASQTGSDWLEHSRDSGHPAGH